MALMQHEDSLCSGCGQPKDAAYNPDADGWYEAHEVVCAGCKAQQSHGKGKEATPGAKLYVVDGRPSGVELRPWSLSGADDEPADEQGDGE